MSALPPELVMVSKQPMPISVRMAQIQRYRQQQQAMREYRALEAQRLRELDQSEAESKEFYNRIGYPQYGGKYKPVSFPEGADYVKSITEHQGDNPATPEKESSWIAVTFGSIGSRQAEPQEVESQAFFNRIGYPQYGGRYEPFDIPPGTRISSVRESGGKLNITYEWKEGYDAAWAERVKVQQENVRFLKAYESGEITKTQYNEAMAFQRQKMKDLTSYPTTPQVYGVTYGLAAPKLAKQVYGVTYGTTTNPNPITKEQNAAQVFYSNLGRPELAQQYAAPDVPEGMKVVDVQEKNGELLFTFGPKNQPPLGIGETAYIGTKVFEDLLLAYTGQENNEVSQLLLRAELTPAYAAVGAFNTWESNIYGYANLASSIVKSIQTGKLQYSPVIERRTGPTTIGSVISLATGSGEGAEMQQRPLGYVIGSGLGEGAQIILESYATGKVTSYLWQRSGLASKTQSFINRRYMEDIETVGRFQPTRTERLLMRMTGVKPNVGYGVVDIPKQVPGATSEIGYKKEYQNFVQKYYGSTSEPMPKDTLFYFKKSPEELATERALSQPIAEAQTTSLYWKKSPAQLAIEQTFPSQSTMPKDLIFGFKKTPEELASVTPTMIDLPPLKTLTAQKTAWNIAISPRSSALLMQEAPISRISPLVRGAWSAAPLGTGTKAITKTVEQTVFKAPTSTPKATTLTRTTTGLPSTAPLTKRIVSSVESRGKNPFTQFAGKPFYQRRSRQSEETTTPIVYPKDTVLPTPTPPSQILNPLNTTISDFVTGRSGQLDIVGAGQRGRQNIITDSLQGLKESQVLSQEVAQIQKQQQKESAITINFPSTTKQRTELFPPSFIGAGGGGGEFRSRKRGRGLWRKREHPIPSAKELSENFLGGKLERKTKGKTKRKK